MRKIGNLTYLIHKKVGWHRKITKFSLLFMAWLVKFKS